MLAGSELSGSVCIRLRLRVVWNLAALGAVFQLSAVQNLWKTRIEGISASVLCTAQARSEQAKPRVTIKVDTIGAGHAVLDFLAILLPPEACNGAREISLCLQP
jgi:hypothetical protein